MSTNIEPLDQSVHYEEPDHKRFPYVNTNSIFYKGLVGMILCLLPGGIIGLVFVKISLDQAKEARIEFNKKPGVYQRASIERVNQGRRFAYIGLTVFILEIVFILTYSSL